MRLCAALKQDRNRLRLDPLWPSQPYRIETFADALDLATFHRQQDVASSRIAADDSEPQTEDAFEGLRIEARARTRPGIPDYQFFVQEVLCGLHCCSLVGDANICFDGRSSYPR